MIAESRRQFIRRVEGTGEPLMTAATAATALEFSGSNCAIVVKH